MLRVTRSRYPFQKHGCDVRSTAACDAGEKMACLELAMLLEKGMGGERDGAKARALKKKACEGVDKRSCDSMILSQENRYKWTVDKPL